MKKFKTVLCGCGHRGIWLAKLAQQTGEFDIVAVCDLYLDKAEQTAKEIGEKYNITIKPFQYVDDMYDQMKPDAVIIACSWEDHARMACEAMERGIAVGLEVGGAYSEQECWDLVDTYERTKTPFMFLENACFNKDELLATRPFPPSSLYFVYTDSFITSIFESLMLAISRLLRSLKSISFLLSVLATTAYSR